MNELIAFLEKLVPAWIAILAILFGYLVYLFKRVADRFITINEKQAEYLKDRVDVVDKTSVIFTRTIEQQEKEIDELRHQLSGLKSTLQDSRNAEANQSIIELSTMSETIQEILHIQDELIDMVSSQKALGAFEERQTKYLERRNLIEQRIEADLIKAVRSRDLSRYSIEVMPFPDADIVVQDLSVNGYFARIYDDYDDSVNINEHLSIWVGKSLPAEIAIETIQIARAYWPFFKYVLLSGDKGEYPPEEVHYNMFFGGATVVSEDHNLKSWTNEDFDNLGNISEQDEFHQFIRQKY